MDRGRHRAILSAPGVGGAILLVLAGSLFAQSPTPTPAIPVPAPVAATATPWVQASPPPTPSPAKPASLTIRVDKESRCFFNKEKEAVSVVALTERLHKLHDAQGDDLHVLIHAEQDTDYAAIVAVLDRAKDAGFKNVAFVVLPGKAASPGPSPLSAASPSREEVARSMAHKREEELAKVPSSAPGVPSPAPGVPSPAPGKPPRGGPPLSPDEHEAYERNLTLWLALPPEERQALRGQATERIREETEKAYASLGLNLNDDQREVFALRYRQERRRLERELQEKAGVERARRLPGIMERLKREFPASTPKPALKQTPAPTVSPAATATPSPAK